MHAFSSLRAVVLLLAVVAACASPSSRPASGGPLVLRDAWARPADSGATSGAYLTIENVDSAARTITGLTTPDAATAELHQTMQHDGMAHMVAQPSLVIPRDSTLVMAPGGLHVMLNAVTRALRVGDTVRLTLTLDGGHTVPVAIPVRAP